MGNCRVRLVIYCATAACSLLFRWVYSFVEATWETRGIRMIVTCTQYNKEKRLSFHRGSVVASLLLDAPHNRLTLVVTSALNHSKFIGERADRGFYLRSSRLPTSCMNLHALLCLDRIISEPHSRKKKKDDHHAEKRVDIWRLRDGNKAREKTPELAIIEKKKAKKRKLSERKKKNQISEEYDSSFQRYRLQ